jgi:hypothetical protein
VQEGAVLGIGHLETMQESAGVSAAAVEVFNLHAAARDASTLKIVLGALFRSAGSFIDQLSSLDERTLAFADRSTQPRAVFLAAMRMPMCVSCGGLLGTVASYDDVFRSITTHVLAPEKSREAILAALARGQCYGVFARQGDARGFDFRFEAGNTIVPMGAEARLDAEAPLTLLRVRTPQSAHITLTRDGAIVAEEDGSELVHPTRIPGRYRVIAYAFERPWIVSSAIDITGEP